MRAQNLWKLGPAIVDEFEILQHNPRGQRLTYLGTTTRGTPVSINSFFIEAEVKVGVGCIIPHSSAGYAGGAKIVAPGLAGLETIEINHAPAEAGETGGVGVIEGNQFRLEVEEIARMAGLDFIANVVVNSRAGIAGIFVGDMVAAHRAGVQLARQVYATPNLPENVDIVVLNAYPKDQNLVNQAINAFDILLSTPKPVVRPGGVIVLMGACPEGPGFDRCADHFMSLMDYAEYRKAAEGKQMVVFSPNVSLPDVRVSICEDCRLFRDWDALIAALHAEHGRGTRVAVFPCATMQVEDRSTQ
jgi:nickel-dependent lactate racemase